MKHLVPVSESNFFYCLHCFSCVLGEAPFRTSHPFRDSSIYLIYPVMRQDLISSPPPLAHVSHHYSDGHRFGHIPPLVCHLPSGPFDLCQFTHSRRVRCGGTRQHARRHAVSSPGSAWKRCWLDHTHPKTALGLRTGSSMSECWGIWTVSIICHTKRQQTCPVVMSLVSMWVCILAYTNDVISNIQSGFQKFREFSDNIFTGGRVYLGVISSAGSVFRENIFANRVS